MPFKKGFRVYLLITGLLFHVALLGQRTTTLPRSIPALQGVSADGINRFIEAANNSKNELHSFMFLRHGKVIAEGWWNPYKPSLKHTMYSVSKSFTSTAVGFAVTEERIKLSDKVVSFFSGDLPDTVNSLLRMLTIKDLITMSAGQSPDPTPVIISEKNWVKHFLSIPVVDTPGSRFLYNSTATYMLSAIIQKVTGERVIDYLKPRLFSPLGISGIDWEMSPEGINSGGWGLRLKTEDMAKFGQLYLQKGKWNGKQVLPEAWIEEATSFKIKNAPDTAVTLKAASEWAQGYCYQFWRCRHNAFRADGAFGQYIIVMPEQDAVIAITSETPDMQSILNLVWDNLLPSIQDEHSAPDKIAQGVLEKKESALSIPVPPVSADPPVASAITGKTFTIQDNDAYIKKVSFRFKNNTCTLTTQYKNAADTLLLVKGKWQNNVSHKPGGGPSLTRTTPPYGKNGIETKTASAYTWKDKQTLLITIRYIETPHTETLIYHFDNDKQLSLRIDNSLKAMTAGENDKTPVWKGTVLLN